MPKISEDFTGVSVSQWDQLPVGTYHAKITSVKEGTSRTNNPKLEVEYVVLHEGFEGAVMKQDVSRAPKAKFQLLGLLAATGEWKPEELQGQFSFDTDDLIGCEVCIEVEAAKTDEGTPFTRIKRALKKDRAHGPVAMPAAQGAGPAPATGAGVVEDLESLFN